jgi:hypothetical protein
MDNHHFSFHLCLWVIATHSAKKKSKQAGLAQQNGFSPEFLHSLLAEIGT